MLSSLNTPLGRLLLIVSGAFSLGRLRIAEGAWAYDPLLVTLIVVPVTAVWVLVLRDHFVAFHQEYKEGVRRIDEEYERDMRRLKKRHARRLKAIDESYDWSIRKLYESAFDEDTFERLRSGDWIEWAPLERPVRRAVGRIVGFEDGGKIVVNRMIRGELVMETFCCSLGASVKVLSLLEVVAWQAAVDEALDTLA